MDEEQSKLRRKPPTPGSLNGSAKNYNKTRVLFKLFLKKHTLFKSALIHLPLKSEAFNLLSLSKTCHEVLNKCQ